MDLEQSYHIAVNDSIPVKKSFDSAENKKKIGPYQDAFFDLFKEGGTWDNKKDGRVLVKTGE